LKKPSIFKVITWVSFVAAALFLCAQTAEDYIRQGDEYYAQLDDAKAMEAYKLAVETDPANYEALWKLSRACVDVADRISQAEPGWEAKQRKLYKEAESYGRKAVRANPNDTWGHFYFSAAMGMYALTLGKKEQINMSKVIKTEIEKAIELDNTNDLAYHALGRWHRRMAEIGGAQRFLGGLIYGSIPKGSFEESEQAFKKAVELRPEYTNHHLELGRTYLAMKKYDLAKQEFEKVLELPVTSSKCEDYKKEAQAELEQLKKKTK
jgi:tetratricopeptide (TPR) repeat protein